MAKVAGLLGRILLGAASVVGVFVVVLVGIGVYLVAIPMRRHGLAPKYALSRSLLDCVVAVNALAAALRDMKAEQVADISEHERT